MNKASSVTHRHKGLQLFLPTAQGRRYEGVQDGAGVALVDGGCGAVPGGQERAKGLVNGTRGGEKGTSWRNSEAA